MTDPVQPEALKCPQCGASLKPGGQETVVCQYCGSNLVFKHQANENGKIEDAVVRGIRLKQFSYTDAEGTGLELFRMLVPVGWQFQGGCRWLLDNPGMPAAVAFQISNPQGAEAFEVLPNMNFTWRNDPMSKFFTPKGTRSFGAEVCPPVHIQEAFRQYVLPRYRGRVQNLQITNEELVPDLPRLARSEAPLNGGWAEGGKVRIRFNWQNTPLEEEIYGVVEVFRAPITSMFGMTEVQIWFIDFLFSFRASAGLLDATADLFSAMIFSFQLNPQWYAAYKTIIQKLAQQQIQRIHHIGQIGQMLAQSGSQMREQNLRDWYSRQEVYDRLATDWSRTIRDVDAFMDPHRQEVVELPAGYGHAWANNLGEYILTEDPNFNPNLSSNQHWEPMEGK
jgi:DNA-directed RNA polymerase subunit RPC12/RpoP